MSVYILLRRKTLHTSTLDVQYKWETESVTEVHLGQQKTRFCYCFLFRTQINTLFTNTTHWNYSRTVDESRVVACRYHSEPLERPATGFSRAIYDCIGRQILLFIQIRFAVRSNVYVSRLAATQLSRIPFDNVGFSVGPKTKNETSKIGMES